MRPRLLFLSAHLPGPEATQAGHKTAFRHLSWLAERFDISYVGFMNQADQKADQAPVRSLCKDVEIHAVTQKSRMVGAVSRPMLPWLVAARWQRQVHRVVRRRIETEPYSRVHVEWAQMAQYLPAARPGLTTWISAHDVMYLGCERNAESSSGFRRALWRWQAQSLYRWERQQYGRVSAVLLHNPKDGQLVADMLGSRRNVRVVPPYFDRYRSRVRVPGKDGPRLLFWGSMGRKENSEAAEWLIREVLPRVAPQLPQVRFIIAGSNPPASLVAAQSAQISVTGFVKDPQGVFDQADAAVLPLFRGAGVKVKVIECLAAGLPVITTPVGSEGIEATEQDGLSVLAGDPQSFSERILSLARDPQRWEAESRAAVAWGQNLDGGSREVLFD